MSPEQVRGLPIDRRSDIFAVGIVLYELLTGERLFIGESDFSTLEKVRNVEIMPPSSYNKKIPQELERVVLKALARDPEDRYANAIDLHDDLQSFLYSVGEFFSRKDLSAWMKKTFAMEIEEDSVKLEEFRQVAPPVASAEVSRRAAVGGLPQGRPGGTSAKPPPLKGPGPGPGKDGTKAKAKANKDSAAKKSEMSWDDEELDTQIFDKEEAKPVAAEDLFFEDEDRTVANEPPPDILEQARPPDLNTPKPVQISMTPEPSGVDIKLTPPPTARPPTPPIAARRPTLVGVGGSAPGYQGPGTTKPGLPPAPTLPGPGVPPGRAGIRRSQMNMQPATSAPPPRRPTPMAPPPPRFHEQPREAPFGTGSFAPQAPARPARRGIVGLALLGVAVLAITVYVYQSLNRPGHLELTIKPADATVFIDNVKVGDKSPLSLERPPGPYTLSVTRDGYARSDQNIELKAGQPLPLEVRLEPSPDTGFEFTSDPPGGLVWLDEAPINAPSGQQVRTNFRASRIAPGHHVLEIKGENRFKPWRQDVEIEPGNIRKIHAVLIPVVGGPAVAAAGSGSGAGVGSKGASATVAAATPTPPAAAVAPPAGKPAGSPAPGSTSTTASPNPTPSPGLVPASATPAPVKRKRREVPADDGSGEPSDEVGGGKETARAAEAECSITINSVPWSELWIDGKNTSRHTPVVDHKIPCGKHKLAFKRPEMQIDQTENINVRPGQPLKKVYTLAVDE
jgi:hypothetical protein